MKKYLFLIILLTGCFLFETKSEQKVEINLENGCSDWYLKEDKKCKQCWRDILTGKQIVRTFSESCTDKKPSENIKIQPKIFNLEIK